MDGALPQILPGTPIWVIWGPFWGALGDKMGEFMRLDSFGGHPLSKLSFPGGFRKIYWAVLNKKQNLLKFKKKQI